MFYVPDTSFSCYVVQSEDVIRAYRQVPSYNSNIAYRDYYIHSDYMFRDGYQQFGNYSTLPICLDNSKITNDFYYRVDLSSILIIFVILALVGIYLPLKIFFKFFRKGNL